MSKLILAIEEIENELHEDLVESTKESDESTGSDDSLLESQTEDEMAIEELFEAISSEILENDKVIAVADGLNDIKTAVSDKEELSSTEISLIDVAANMGTAGTDIEGSQLLPATEKFSDKNFALETLSTRIALAQEGIFQSVKNTYEKIKDFLKTLFVFAHRQEKRINEAKQMLQQISTLSTKSIRLQIKKQRYLLKDNENYVENTDEYLTSLKQSTDFFAKWSPIAVKTVGDFYIGFRESWKLMFNKDLRAEKTETFYNTYMKKFVSESIAAPGVSKINVNSAPNTNIYQSKPLLGGVFLTITVPKSLPDFDIDKVKELKRAINDTYVIFGSHVAAFGVKGNGEKNIWMEFDAKALNQIISSAEKSLAVYKNFLNTQYKIMMNVAKYNGLANDTDTFTTLYSQIYSKGINNALVYTNFAKHTPCF